VPDIFSLVLNLAIWLVAGIAGGNAAGDLLKGDYNLGPGITLAGAIGGVAAFVFRTALPGFSEFDIGSVIGQIAAAAVGGAALTMTAGAIGNRRR
jgi:hypothetical protein